MTNIVIKVENISKQYRLGEVGTGTLSHDINRWWHIVRGKEDPYLKIGEENDRTKKGNSQYVWALRDVNFEVKQGEVLGIIGRNGAGKSTLLKILSRTTTPSQGNVKIKGRVASLLEVGTGFHPELSGRDNIFLNGAILGMSKSEIKKNFDKIVDFAGVEKYIDTPVKRYSSGMYVRLAFGVAAHLESDILIVDEVLAVGDAEFQRKALGKMQDVSKGEGRTVFFVSHNMGSIVQLCSRGILMQHGKIKTIGNIKEVVEDYVAGDKEFEDGYISDASEKGNKKNFFHKIYCTNLNGARITDISFNEQIVLNFSFVINEDYPSLQIGIGLNDKYQNRIFTVLKPVSFFKTENGNIYNGKVILPANVIAPNIYSFTMAIWIKDMKPYDLVENVCLVKIHDSGTELALYEDIDYGSIIVNPEWHAS